MNFKILLGCALVCVANVVMASDLMIKDAWIRAMPPVSKVTGGFLTIHNHSSKDISLIAASVDFSDRVEIHEHAHVDGMMKMREVEGGIVVPANGMVELKPGGYHLMMMDVEKIPAEGEIVQVEMEFSNGETMTANFPVKKGAAKSEMKHHGEHDHHSDKHDMSDHKHH